MGDVPCQDCPEAFGDKELASVASALPSGLTTLNLCLHLGLSLNDKFNLLRLYKACCAA